MWLGASPWLSSQESAYCEEMQEMWVQSLHWEDPLEEEMATRPSILAWRIPWTGDWWVTVQRVAKSQTRLSD